MNDHTRDTSTHNQDPAEHTTQNLSSGTDNALLKCQQDLADFKDKYLRLSADYQNMMRRIEKERATFKKMMLDDILLNLLNIFDNLEQVRIDILSGQTQVATWQQAIEFMHKDFLKLFNKYGVKEITEYQMFNPELHEAVMQVDAPDKKSGDVIQVLQKGYLLDGEILRIAKVSIAK